MLAIFCFPRPVNLPKCPLTRLTSFQYQTCAIVGRAVPENSGIDSNQSMNPLDIPAYSQTLGLKAKQASALMARAQTATKNRALRKLAEPVSYTHLTLPTIYSV